MININIIIIKYILSNTDMYFFIKFVLLKRQVKEGQFMININITIIKYILSNTDIYFFIKFVLLKRQVREGQSNPMAGSISMYKTRKEKDTFISSFHSFLVNIYLNLPVTNY